LKKIHPFKSTFEGQIDILRLLPVFVFTTFKYDVPVSFPAPLYYPLTGHTKRNQLISGVFLYEVLLSSPQKSFVIKREQITSDDGFYTVLTSCL